MNKVSKDNKEFLSTFYYKVIYIFRINDEEHENKLKIGDATLKSNKDISELKDNSEELKKAARERINDYTSTAGICYELLHVEVAVTNDNKAFRDYDVHDVLIRSGINRFYFDTERKQNEWFITDLNTAKNAIKAVKEGRKSLTSSQITKKMNPIKFRPEQLKAIDDTIRVFEKKDNMLWNAKMRFGKTLTALEVVKRMKFKKTIIITHRPAVNKGWFDDFNKIFWDNDEYTFGSKFRGESIDNLLKKDKPFIYFATIQDLRGSKQVGGIYAKDEIIFNCQWDCIIIDEAHEGTKTEQGTKTIDSLVKIDDNYKTKVLRLSGTPFNLLEDFSDDEIYTWDYIMEQSAKIEWEKNNYGDSNPYADLPKLNIFTYYLDKMIPEYFDTEDKAFNFREFFRTWTGNIENDGIKLPRDSKIGDFVHKTDVRKFLDLLTKDSPSSNYPYSNETNRNYFRHSLWMVPGVKEAKALSKLLREHPVFGSGAFEIVNVAGDGDEEKNYKDALEAVQRAIGKKPETNYTITISCTRLTTGVSVPEWTAVLMMSGTYSTAASRYLQTIFRVQTPAKIGGKIKENCYVFDFAPDRALKMIAQAGQLSIKPGSVKSRTIMSQFLNFCPVIGIDGSSMIHFNVDKMLRQLKKAVAQKVVDNGFDDKNIYNDNLLKLDKIDIEEFEKLREIIGKTKANKKSDKLVVNHQGYDNEKYEEDLDALSKKPKKELTKEEKRRLEELKEQKKTAGTAISILRGISIRIPLLIYGANIPIDEDIDCDNFIDFIDEKSWKEFMPSGVTKEIFIKFKKYYDKEIFIEAGRQIRSIALYADTLPIKERIKRIGTLFLSFKNPDKETVLTPWNTVNMHMSDCIGGYRFNTDDGEPVYVNKGLITSDLLNNKHVKILEINSKTGLYSLYLAYTLYMNKLLNYNKSDYSENMNEDFWKSVLKENIFIVCRTKMAEYIVRRTLSGYKNYDVNVFVYEDLSEELRENDENSANKILNSKNWNRKDEKMNFDVVVGNPPYQENISNNENNSSLGKQLFPTFISGAIKTKAEYISLITPSRWFAGDAQDKSFVKLREFIKNNNHISDIYNYPDANDVFEDVTIKGGVSYFLYDKKHSGNTNFYNVSGTSKILQIRPLFEDGLDIILSDSMEYQILSKVQEKDGFSSLTNITKGRNAFGIVGKTDYLESISSNEYFEGSIRLQCKNKEIRYTNPSNVTKSIDVFNSYKVFISKSAGDPQKDKKVIGIPYLAKPNEACTDSLIPIGKFDNEDEARNLQKYLRTKFLRFLVSIMKVSQNVYQNVYQFVPIIEFKNGYDIDWSKSVKEIDTQLYDMYNLSKEEISYIENRVSE